MNFCNIPWVSYTCKRQKAFFINLPAIQAENRKPVLRLMVSVDKQPRRICRPQAANQVQSIFARGVYLGENSSQSASLLSQKGRSPFGIIQNSGHLGQVWRI